ncbi:hypothetical protein RI129_007018 [Pyrocoelia pectoralis]|uniref:Mutator-like transposase domain-containing protein n=1 Tax=Pyrocoelia pectoralis TaxID=417401 RepID=A0AAN7VD84_9COLE
MQESTEEEKKLAIEAGNVEDSFPYITVAVDGGWAKRSYGHSYSSLSGVACIIGQKTQKILYIGVKNKFCYMCATTKREHTCFKNFTGSSASMEQAAIVDGFNQSEKIYGIRYKYVVGDGDSSVYARIQEKVSYGRSVIKLECANHCVRAYTAALHCLIKNRQFQIESRNILKKHVGKISSCTRKVIAKSSDLLNMKMQLKDSFAVVMGNDIKLLEHSPLFLEMEKARDNVIRKADRLLRNVTTNPAERYTYVNSIQIYRW